MREGRLKNPSDEYTLISAVPPLRAAQDAAFKAPSFRSAAAEFKEFKSKANTDRHTGEPPLPQQRQQQQQCSGKTTTSSSSSRCSSRLCSSKEGCLCVILPSSLPKERLFALRLAASRQQQTDSSRGAVCEGSGLTACILSKFERGICSSLVQLASPFPPFCMPSWGVPSFGTGAPLLYPLKARSKQEAPP
ncbi:hypothetical protein Efla_007526 [Eimeria flavescens]